MSELDTYMRETGGKARVVTYLTVHGKTLNEVEETARKQINEFFEKKPWEYLSIEARPSAQAIGGEIFMWEADVEAGEVFA